MRASAGQLDVGEASLNLTELLLQYSHALPGFHGSGTGHRTQHGLRTRLARGGLNGLGHGVYVIG